MSIKRLFETLGLPTTNAHGHELGCSCDGCQKARQSREPFPRGSIGELLGSLLMKHRASVAESLDSLCGTVAVQEPASIELTLPEPVPAWRKCTLWLEGAASGRWIETLQYTPDFSLESATIGNEDVHDRPFPWGPIAPGERVRLRFSNNSTDPRPIVVRVFLTGSP
jgi:hypothetical protein